MSRSGLRLVTLAVGLVLCFGVLKPLGMAFADDVSWTGGNPSLQPLGTIQSSDTKRNLPCNWMTVTVVNNILNTIVTNEQPLCMVQTLEGLVDIDGRYIEPNGYSKAYAIQNNAAGVGSIMPIPNQAGALLLRGDRTFPGSNISLYKDLFSHLSFNILTQKFVLTDQPDLTFSYANNRPLPINASTMAFSADGNYMVTDVVFQGFVRIDINTLDIKPFAATLPRTINNMLQAASVAVDNSGRFAAIGYNGKLSWGGVNYLKIIDVDSCSGQLAGTQYDTTMFSCSQSDQYPFMESQIGIRGIAGLSFINDRSMIVDTLLSAGGYGRYQMTAHGQPQRLEQYLAMGDSYISGEGAFNYRSGTDTETNRCHQSLSSYPYLMAHLFDSFADVACSGAVIDNVVGNDKNHNDFQTKPSDATPSRAQEKVAQSNHVPGVLIQSKFSRVDNPEVITLSIGGNDVHFSEIVKRCVVPLNNFSSASSNCYQTYEDRLELITSINNQFNNLVLTYNTLKSNAPDRRIYVVGYPQVVATDGDCGLNVRLSQSDRAFASQLIAYLDYVIEQATNKSGVFYVDTQHAFDGHKLCEPSPAVNGLTEGNDSWTRLGNESYHPNARGHQLLADAVQSQTHNLTAPMPAPDDTITIPTINDNLEILQAPHTGRTVYEVQNVLNDGVTLLRRANPISLTTNIGKGIIKQGSHLVIELHSSPIELGSATATGDGELTGSFQLPADIPPGFHTLHFYGQNLAGDPVDVQQLVYVVASDTDYDGDGIANNVDSCTSIANSGVDVDQDGTDDTCDSVIGAAPVETTGGDNQSNESTNQSGGSNTAKSDITPTPTLQLSTQTTVVAMLTQNISKTSQLATTPLSSNRTSSTHAPVVTNKVLGISAKMTPKSKSQAKQNNFSWLFLPLVVIVALASIYVWRRKSSNI